MVAAGDTTGISGLRGSENFHETLTKAQPAFGENNGGWTLFLPLMKGELSYYLKVCHSKHPISPQCAISELLRGGKKISLNNPQKSARNEVSFRGNELQFNTIIISDIKGLRIVSHAQKLLFFLPDNPRNKKLPLGTVSQGL